MHNRSKWITFYAVVALLTFLFQSWVRHPQCASVDTCALAFAKAAVWAVAWPGSWVVYFAGYVSTASLAGWFVNFAGYIITPVNLGSIAFLAVLILVAIVTMPKSDA